MKSPLPRRIASGTDAADDEVVDTPSNNDNGIPDEFCGIFRKSCREI